MRHLNLPLRPLLEEYGVEFNPEYEENQQVSCPVHPDRDPSCSVRLSENDWHCFSCGKGGGPIQLVMEREGLGYHDAVSRATELVGDAVGEVRDTSSLGGWGAASARVAGHRSFVPPWRRNGTAARA